MFWKIDIKSVRESGMPMNYRPSSDSMEDFNDIYIHYKGATPPSHPHHQLYFYPRYVVTPSPSCKSQPQALHSRESRPEPQLDEPLRSSSHGWGQHPTRTLRRVSSPSGIILASCSPSRPFGNLPSTVHFPSLFKRPTRNNKAKHASLSDR